MTARSGAEQRRRKVARGSGSFCAILALSAAPALARSPPGAQPSTAAPRVQTRALAEALSVEAGATCLDHELLLADLQSWREQDSVDPRVEIRVMGSSDDPQRVQVELWIGPELAVDRSFDPGPPTCVDLHAVVALAIAIALDDTLAAQLGIMSVPAPVSQASAGEGDLPAPEDVADEPERRRRPAMSLTLAGGLFVGLAPGLSAGGLLSFDLRPLDHLDLRFGALATHHPSVSLDEGSVAVSVTAGRFDLCWGTRPGKLRLRLCGGAAAGATISQGRGFSENFSRSTPWFAGLAGADLAVHLIGPLALELRVEGVFPFQRTSIDVRDSGGMLLDSVVSPVAGAIIAVGPRLEF